jgi:hypothetical protein
MHGVIGMAIVLERPLAPLCSLSRHLFSTHGVPLIMREAGAGNNMFNQLPMSRFPLRDRTLALWKVVLKIDIRVSTILL